MGKTVYIRQNAIYWAERHLLGKTSSIRQNTIGWAKHHLLQGRTQDFVKGGGESVKIIISSKIYNLRKKDRWIYSYRYATMNPLMLGVSWIRSYFWIFDIFFAPFFKQISHAYFFMIQTIFWLFVHCEEEKEFCSKIFPCPKNFLISKLVTFLEKLKIFFFSH